jgi:hypothetical protein
VTATEPALSEPAPAQEPSRPTRPGTSSWLLTWALITTKNLELRKRHGVMITLVVLVVVPVVLALGLRLLFHAVAPATNGPAGTPDVFQQLANLIAEFGFLAAAVLGAAAGTTDLSDGVFRHMVITGRSRLALYLARIPAGLAIIVPLVALAFTMTCLVTAYAGTPDPTTVNLGGLNVPAHLSQSSLETWLLQHPRQAASNLPLPSPATPAQVSQAIHQGITSYYGDYTASEVANQNPAINEMAKIGLWLELEAGIGFLVGLGLCSLTGQRSTSTILLIALEIIVTPILAAHVIPYFIDGQRLIIGVAMDQLRPAGLAPAAPGGGGGGGPGPGHILFGGRGALGIPPMPTWAMISVIVCWIILWSGLGAWRMMTRDA